MHCQADATRKYIQDAVQTIGRIRHVAGQTVATTQGMAGQSIDAAEQISSMDAQISDDQHRIAASLDSLRGQAGNVDAMHESIDQIRLLERLAAG